MIRRDAARALTIGALAAWAFVAACRREPPVAGFWYESHASFTLPGGDATRIGGPLTPGELQSIERSSRDEVVRAFAGFRLTITNRRDALWTVAVRPDIPGRSVLPGAGASVALAPLGGSGAVDFDVLADLAVQLAPAGASRADVVAAIGRGVGRAAVHELAHQILGTSLIHNAADLDSYEYPTADRASQYYGTLHWTTAWPALVRRFGTTGPGAPPRG